MTHRIISLLLAFIIYIYICRAAIGMAMYIHKLQRRKCGGDELPFGYKRAEVIGGLINSVALVSLSVYVSDQALVCTALCWCCIAPDFTRFGSVVGESFFKYCSFRHTLITPRDHEASRAFKSMNHS